MSEQSVFKWLSDERIRAIGRETMGVDPGPLGMAFAHAIIETLIPDLLGVRESSNQRPEELRERALAALEGADAVQGWIDFRITAPELDGETVYVGENENGYMGCFNYVTKDGMCFMDGPEENDLIMNGLRYWRRLERPSASDGEAK